MKRLTIFWCIHFTATVVGWYVVSALAQGVADGTGIAPSPLVIAHEVVTILALPLVGFARQYMQGIGEFSLTSFIAFTAIAAVNSALVVAVISQICSAVMKLSSNNASE